MPKIEPVYEPRGDAFDGGEDDLEHEEDEGSRLPLLIVIGLLVLAAFGGVVWLAYQHGVERGMKDAPRQIVAQDAQAPSQNYDKIYQKPAPSDEDTANDDTAPPPPTMKSDAAPAAVTLPPSKAAPTPIAPASKVAAKIAVPVVPPPVRKAARPEPVATKPPPKLVLDTQTASTVTAKPKPADTTPAPNTPAPSTPRPSTPAPVAASTATGGAYVLQIGSYKSEDEAASSWRTYKAKHSVAAGYSDSIAKADLGAKGTWYRLRLGGFATKDAAEAFCAKLKADGGDCIPAKS